MSLQHNTRGSPQKAIAKQLTPPSLQAQSGVVEQSNQLIESCIMDLESNHGISTLSRPTLNEFKLALYVLSKINPTADNDDPVVVTLGEYWFITGWSPNAQAAKVRADFRKQIIRLFNLSFRQTDEKQRTGWRHFFDVMYDDESGDVAGFLVTPEIAPFLYDLKNRYTKYRVSNILKLRSVNAIILYQLLKEHAYEKVLRISCDKIIELFGGKKNYSNWTIFSQNVLNVCRESISRLTDISFEYSVTRGPGHKALYVTFFIEEAAPPKAEPDISEIPPANYLPPAGTHSGVIGYDLTSYKEGKDLDDVMAKINAKDVHRSEIGFCFDNPLFDIFTDAQLLSLKLLAGPVTTATDLARHDCLANVREQMDAAIASHIELALLDMRARAGNVENPYLYLRSVFIKEYEKLTARGVK